MRKLLTAVYSVAKNLKPFVSHGSKESGDDCHT